jgi:hypothetical protein
MAAGAALDVNRERETLVIFLIYVHRASPVAFGNQERKPILSIRHKEEVKSRILFVQELLETGKWNYIPLSFSPYRNHQKRELV